MLEKKELCVCEITSALNLAPSTVSKHISILRDAGLVVDEKKGKWVHCHLPQRYNSEIAGKIVELLKEHLNEYEQIISDSEFVNKIICNGVCKR